MRIREPAVNGTFYPAGRQELLDIVKKFIVPNSGQPEVIGCYIPHAGYKYSGAVAGATLSRVPVKDTYIILGPSHTGMGVPYSLMAEGKWKTPLGEAEIDVELARSILDGKAHLKNDYQAHVGEHAIEVQLPFIQYINPKAQIVPITLRDAPVNVYREIGQAIAQAVKESGKNVGLIASGDMTHYESAKAARLKDMRAIEAMLKLDAEELLDRVHTLGITMCGYAPAATLIFAVKELGANKADLVKYQTSGDINGDMSAVVGYAGIVFLNRAESSLVKLARETIESYVVTGAVPKPKVIPPEMQRKAGVFVSIHKGEELRGCIGTIEPQEDNIAKEIIQNSISASTRDPRFFAITPSELEQLNYSVDVLTEPEPVKDKTQLDAKKYGVIVQSGRRRGLLLPDLEGVDTVDEQIEICLTKGGIGSDEPYKIFRFEVKRYH